MSWSLEAVGTKHEIAERVEGERHMPVDVRASIVTTMNAFRADERLTLSTWGHVNELGGEENARIEIRTAPKVAGAAEG